MTLTSYLKVPRKENLKYLHEPELFFRNKSLIRICYKFTYKFMEKGDPNK